MPEKKKKNKQETNSPFAPGMMPATRPQDANQETKKIKIFQNNKFHQSNQNQGLKR
jgi:hypothetical protein